MDNKSNVRKSSYNIATDAVGKILTIVISIIIPKLYIDNYGSDFNGLLNSLNGIFVYLNLLEAGIGSASIQALYKPITEKNYEKINGILSATRAYYLRQGFFFLSGLIAVSFCYPSFSHSDIDYWTIVLLVILSGTPYIAKFFFQGKYTVLLTADNSLYVLNIISNGIHVAANIIKAILLINRVNIILVQAVFACVYLLQVVLTSAYVRKRYEHVSFTETPDKLALSKSKSAMIHEFAYIVFNNTDVLLLTYFCGFKVVSVYSVYNMIFAQITLLLQSITTGSNAGLGQLMVTDRTRYNRLFQNFEYTFQCFAAFVLISVGIMSTPFVRLYTINATDINYMLPGLAFLFTEIQILSLMRWPGVGAIKAAGMFKETQWRALAEVIINLVTSIIMIQRYQIYGVLIGTIVALLYRTFDVILFTRQKILFTSKQKAMLKVIALIILTTLLLIGESRLNMNCRNYFIFLIKGCGIFAFNMALFFIYSMLTNRAGFSRILELVKNRFVRRR